MGVIRKVPRPAGIILISFLKLLLMIFIIMSIMTVIARYNIGFLHTDSFKEGIINKITYVIFPNGKEVIAALILCFALFTNVFLIAGMWSRKKWVWFLEISCCLVLTLFTIYSIFIIDKMELYGVQHISKFIGIIVLITLIFGFTFILYLTKKHVRDYFGIFKRRLR